MKRSAALAPLSRDHQHVGINQGGEPFARETLALLTRGFKS
jgi:hypothetical protein